MRSSPLLLLNGCVSPGTHAEANDGQGVCSGLAKINLFDAFACPETAADGDASDSHESADVADEVVDSSMANDDSAYGYDEYDSSGDRQHRRRQGEEHEVNQRTVWLEAHPEATVDI